MFLQKVISTPKYTIKYDSSHTALMMQITLNFAGYKCTVKSFYLLFRESG
ncbi:hypothetical protein VCR17J2_350538 [Vibrio coralliirubri]|nr:hypothetical protein VCR17J2_350538 [Vibrio coralliirubri]